LKQQLKQELTKVVLVDAVERSKYQQVDIFGGIMKRTLGYYEF